MLEFVHLEIPVELSVTQEVENIAEVTGMSATDIYSAALTVMLSTPKESALKRIMRKVRDWQIDRLVVLYREKQQPTTKSPKPKEK